MRNGALLSLLSAGIIGIALEMDYGLITGLEEAIRYGPSNVSIETLIVQLEFGLSLVLDTALSGDLIYQLGVAWLVTWAATGGLTILRHYLLRLLLAQGRTLPWRARRFLDDATARVLLRRVGGGYGFVHRRLLDYFAAPPTLPGEDQ